MIKKVAVIGAGIMGSGIAAQIANNGIEVLLYDLKNENGLIADASIKKQISSSNSQFIHPTIAKYITPKSLDDDLEYIKDCDLIIEAIIEKLDVKKTLFNNLSKYVKNDAIIASNTSTFRLSEMIEGLPDNIKNSICICHFFNPPRQMRLLEFVSYNLAEVKKYKLSEFLNKTIGKDVIFCKDTPGFIANRLGCYLMELIFQESLNTNLKIEEIDIILSKFFGFPSTGIFGLYDLIGLDVMNYIQKSLTSNLHENDDFKLVYHENPDFMKMITNGYNGRKGKGGFYKLEINELGNKVKYSIDLKNFTYIEITKTDINYENIDSFFASNTELSNFIERIFKRFFKYVTTNSDEISYDIHDIDKALKLGFAWKYGPYELMNRLKFDNIKLIEEKLNINPPAINKDVILFSNKDSSLLSLKSEKLCLEFSTKMNVLTPEIFDAIIESCKIAEERNSDLIIYSDSCHFSAGADLKLFYKFIKNNDYTGAEEFLKLGQKAMISMKYCKSPIISCARGVALGGGCEILLHSDYVIAHQELQAGLVEATIGLIPGWGGTKEMLMRDNPTENLKLILNSYKSTSSLDFAYSFKQNNVISLANFNGLLDFAISHKFHKEKSKINSINNLPKIDISDPQNNLSKILVENFFNQKNINEQDLLDSERKIFLNLLFTSETKAKLEKYI